MQRDHLLCLFVNWSGFCHSSPVTGAFWYFVGSHVWCTSLVRYVGHWYQITSVSSCILICSKVFDNDSAEIGAICVLQILFNFYKFVSISAFTKITFLTSCMDAIHEITGTDLEYWFHAQMFLLIFVKMAYFIYAQYKLTRPAYVSCSVIWMDYIYARSHMW